MQTRILLILVLAFVPSLAFAAPGELCVESYDCSLANLLESPFSNILMPLDFVLPGFGMLVVWGPVVLAIWLISKDATLTGIFGMLISGVMTGLNPDALAMGIMLFVVSLGFSLFTLWPRLKNVA